jgi:hypothetical protein
MARPVDRETEGALGAHITATESRQGVTGHHVRIVLVSSLLLAIIAGVCFILYWARAA